MRGSVRRAAAAAIAAALVVGLAACVPEPSAGEARRDPAPSFADARTTQVDRDGAHWSAGGVTVDVPDGAVAANVANVTVGERIGATDSGIAAEVLGAPVRVDSAAAFSQPVSISWDVSALPDEAAAVAALVRWDDRRRVWVPDPGHPAVSGGTLSAQLTSGGIVTWAAPSLADASPPLEPPADARRPSCNDAALPAWVTAIADPTQDWRDGPLAVCFEGTAADGVAVKNADRGGAARILELDGGSFDWAKRDDAPPLFWRLAADTVDGEGRALLPPGGTVDVGLAEPADGSPYRAHARADARTVAMDLLAGLSARAAFGEVPSAAYGAFVRAMLACAEPDDQETPDVDAIAATLTDCATALGDPASPAAQRYAAERGAEDPDAEDGAAVQGDRAVAALVRLAARGALAETAAVRGDALLEAATAAPGGARWIVYGDAPVRGPGEWTPTCDDVEADADALFDALVTQPDLAGAAPEDQPGWDDAVTAAAAPLADCDADHRTSLMARLPSLWTRTGAAASAAEAIAGLGLSLLSCDDLFDLAAPLAAGFHELRGVTASGTGRVACGWSSERGRAITDRDPGSRVQVWVSREDVDAAEVDRRRADAERTELGGVQRSRTLDAAGGFVVGAYVPTGLELEAWLPGYRIVVTTTSDDDPAQWRMREGVTAVSRIAAALTVG